MPNNEPEPQQTQPLPPTPQEIPQDMETQGGAEEEMVSGDNIQDDEGPFDSNFDAGVEADEDEDPKKYIQQLTGKLSQTLNTYNNENGDDEELSKYVGKMIVKAAAKGLDEKGRKELIKSINTTPENDEEEEIDDEDVDVEEELNETVYTKRQLEKLLRG